MTVAAQSPASVVPARSNVTRYALRVARALGQLAALLFVILTILFFLVRITGDPAFILAGDYADQATLDAIRAKYGLDRSLVEQYLLFWSNALQLDFGESLSNRRPALDLVWERIPATLVLAATGMLANLVIAIPLGTFLGTSKLRPLRRSFGLAIFLAQGIPGYVAGLLLIQFLSVELGWFPSTGNIGTLSWVLPSLTVAAFLTPKLVRVISVNVAENLDEEFVTMARAQGSSYYSLVVRHALPNALLGATALVGAQLATLLNGIVITETIFGWPGVGRLLLDSVLFLDFPVVQAIVLVITVLVFVSNAVADKALEVIDPRLRGA